MCIAGVLHNGRDVCKVQVDQTGEFNQVRDTLYTLAEHIVCNGKCVYQRNTLLTHEFEALVRNHHKGIHMFTQGRNAAFCLFHATSTFKRKGFCHNTHGQHAHIARNFRHNRCRARAGSASHTGGDKHHIASANGCSDGLAALFARLLAHLRLGACALSVRNLFTNLDFLHRFGAVERLLVRIDGNKLHALNSHRHHAVDCVSAAAADTDHFYLYNIVKIIINLKRHCCVPLKRPFIS